MIEKYIVVVVSLLSFLSFISADVNIVTRQEWEAKEPSNALTPLELPVGRVIIAHTAGNDCSTKDSCSRQVRIIQHYHMSKYHIDDIAYNYLIGNDGNVYEGRGWNYQGALVKGYNVGSFGIVFMGNFIKELPSEKALTAAKALLEKLVNLQKLKENYKLFGHSQLMPTISPGDALLAEIKKWPKWSDQI
ncbi:peptidoglycan-recognition protein SD [Lucilia sericata]|uniref:peptidoglycan-recognition protein SD n=1 Tax=Lucilia sericata TaxID=13632 RepID=UPI0018A7F839|nr:peptidoglycan-recognition protein SD [Lucilia sericata]